MSEIVALVANVSKKYCREPRRSLCYALRDIVRECAGGRGPVSQLRPGEFWALEDVSFAIRRGECVGLIGANGAGKSTLLKLLNGILRPDRGRIHIRGRVGALIEVGAGFHPSLTGRENVYVNGAILGLSRREVDRKLESILEFSGLEPSVLDVPVRTYSSGMFVRLGFAVAAHCEPDLLLIDEILSVGDLAFVGRCRRFVSGLVERGAAVFLVSHRLNEVEGLCHRALLLENGRLVESGDPGVVIASYRRRTAECTLEEARMTPAAGAPRIRELRLTDAVGRELRSARVGERAQLEVLLAGGGAEFRGDLRIWLARADTGAVAAAAGIPWHVLARRAADGRFRCGFPLMLMPGEYHLGVQVRGEERFAYVDQCLSAPFAVEEPDAGPPYVPPHTLAACVLDLQIEQPATAALPGHARPGRPC